MGEKAEIQARTPALIKGSSLSGSHKSTAPQSALSPVDLIMNLNQTLGNQAVQRLFRSGLLQAKLRIGQPNDIYEQEADRVAEWVMRIPEPGIQRTCAPCASGGPLCPKCSEEEKLNIRRRSESSSSGPPVPDNFVSSLGAGQPLDRSTRDYFEPRFGTDFSSVRVHSGPQAAESAASIEWLGVDDTLLELDGPACHFARPGSEEKKLYDGARQLYNLSSQVKVFFVENYTDSTVGMARDASCCQGSPYCNHILLRNEAPEIGLAHELGHVLLADGVHSKQKNNLMGEYAGVIGTVLDADQRLKIYSNAGQK